MFEATLKNRSQPELGTLTVTFPIPEERYENVLVALQHLEIGDAAKQDCYIDSIHATNCPALCRMNGTLANVDELTGWAKSWRVSTNMSCCNLMQQRSNSDYPQRTS